MILESIHNNIDPFSSKNTKIIQNKQRVISESTGLVKFSLGRNTDSVGLVEDKVNGYSKLTKEFQSLELNMNKVDLSAVETKEIPPRTLRTNKSGLDLRSSVYSPKRSPDYSVQPQTSPLRRQLPKTGSPVKEPFDSAIEKSDEAEKLFIELAAKQRQVLDYQTQIQILREKSKQSEKELHELEKKCNQLHIITPSDPFSKGKSNKINSSSMSSENPFVNTLRSKASISQIRSQIESSTAIHQQNFNTLKKKLSMSQMSSSSDSFHSNQSKTSSKTSINLNENISKLQNETKTMFSKSFKYVNTLSKEIQCKLKNEPLLKHDEFNGDTSDEESGASGWKRRTILQEDISKPIENGIKLYSHDEKDEHEDYDDDYTDFNETGEWGYGEADASDYMVAVK